MLKGFGVHAGQCIQEGQHHKDKVEVVGQTACVPILESGKSEQEMKDAMEFGELEEVGAVYNSCRSLTRKYQVHATTMGVLHIIKQLGKEVSKTGMC
eukprot:768802-Hanusia_phi.AAC.10